MITPFRETLEREFTLKREIVRLSDAFKGIFGLETVDRHIRESLDAFENVRVKDFVPLFVHRFSRERLRALAQVQGRISKDVPEVRFVCVHNAGRSQMAAELTQHRSGGRVHVRSAGSDPADQINPVAIEVMAELGIDLSEEFPKPLTDEVVQAADAVITMGCGDACPVYPGKKHGDWEIADPAGEPPAKVRQIRDSIALRVELLLADLGVPRQT